MNIEDKHLSSAHEQPNTLVLPTSTHANLVALAKLSGKRAGRRRSRQCRGTRARNFTRAKQRLSRGHAS